MKHFAMSANLATLCVATALTAGCGAVNSLTGKGEPRPATTTASTASSAATATPKSKAGFDDRGNVVDPAKIEAGSGQPVKGIDGYEGEIAGNPVPGTKFTQLRIGMGMKQVTDIAGAPTDQGAYITGKAFIPFFFGGDRYRHELHYKGFGRLVFAGGSMGDLTAGKLIWIIHSANETGYR